MKTLPPALPIKSASPPRLSHSLVPKLKWPSFDSNHSMVDLERFPSFYEEINRYTAGEFGVWSEGFISAVRSASSRVWLIDSFLFKIDNPAKNCFFDVFECVLHQTAAQNIR